ncbi:MAG: hypothetical protein ACPGYX_03485 [Oceanobacter sp.]
MQPTATNTICSQVSKTSRSLLQKFCKPVATAVASLALFSAAQSQAENTNFRVGLGSTTLDVSPAAEYLPTTDEKGLSLFAEFPQSNHAASRFIMYRAHQNDKDLTGFETQLMWGWGLAQPGFRLYAGPAWHREKILVDRTGGSRTRFFNGWGLQAGLGYQLKAITLDIATTWRDDQDYRFENRRSGVENTRPDVFLTNLLISYRF